MVTLDASIEAALEPVKLLNCVGQAGGDVGRRFAVQPLWLDEAGTSGRIPEGAIRFRTVWAWLWALFLPAASFPATASPRSRMSFMTTFGLASTR